MRDAQRARLYRAEQAVRSPHDDTVFSSVGEAQEFLDSVLRPAFADRDDLERKLVVRLGQDSSKSTYNLEMGECSIDLAPGWGHTGLVLSHEYAHHLVPWEVPNHGADFARTFLDVAATYAPDAARDLRASFTDHKVVFDPWHQWNAARNQVARIRSDMGGSKANPDVFLPVKAIVYATAPDDFVGHSYRYDHALYIRAADTYGDGIRITDVWSDIPGPLVRWEQLRYVEADMIRAR